MATDPNDPTGGAREDKPPHFDSALAYVHEDYRRTVQAIASVIDEGIRERRYPEFLGISRAAWATAAGHFYPIQHPGLVLEFSPNALDWFEGRHTLFRVELRDPNLLRMVAVHAFSLDVLTGVEDLAGASGEGGGRSVTLAHYWMKHNPRPEAGP